MGKSRHATDLHRTHSGRDSDGQSYHSDSSCKVIGLKGEHVTQAEPVRPFPGTEPLLQGEGSRLLTKEALLWL